MRNENLTDEPRFNGHQPLTNKEKGDIEMNKRFKTRLWSTVAIPSDWKISGIFNTHMMESEVFNGVTSIVSDYFFTPPSDVFRININATKNPYLQDNSLSDLCDCKVSKEDLIAGKLQTCYGDPIRYEILGDFEGYSFYSLCNGDSNKNIALDLELDDFGAGKCYRSEFNVIYQDTRLEILIRSVIPYAYGEDASLIEPILQNLRKEELPFY